MNPPLRVLSLFSGIGGLDLGLERAGMRVVAHSEIDEYASRVLAKHWPDVPNLGDITTIEWAPWHGRIDVIVGGFPCQGASNAGLRLGMDDPRTGLWTEYHRAIRTLRPRYVIIENVPGLAARGLDRVLCDLADSGYDAAWRVVSARDVGAPHLRKRLWIVATDAHQTGVRFQPGWVGGSHRPQTLQLADDGAPWPTPDAGTGRCEGDEERDSEPQFWLDESPRWNDAHRRGSAAWRAARSPVCGVDDGISDRVDRNGCLGNAVVPQVAEYIGRLVVEHAERVDRQAAS